MRLFLALFLVFSFFISNSYAANTKNKTAVPVVDINAQVEGIVSSFVEDVNAVYPVKVQNAKFKGTMDNFYSDFRSYLTLYFTVYDKLPEIIGSDVIKDLDGELKKETGTTVWELNEKMKGLTRTIDEKISPEIFKYLAREKYKAQRKAAQSASKSKANSKIKKSSSN